MTKEEILSMEAGPEIDALFAELVMGYIINDSWYKGFYGASHGRYSTNISHAMEGVEKHKENLRVALQWTGTKWIVQAWGKSSSTDWVVIADKHLELAITRTLILWAMEKETTNEKPRRFGG